MVQQKKWYVVIVGTKPGVYSSWIEAGPKTKNIPGGSIHQSFPSKDEAIQMFESARERGEVKAYPNAGKDESTGESKNAPLSPLGEGAALLRTPPGLKVDAGSTGLRAPFSSPSAHEQVSKLRQTLRESTGPCLASSSPPTGVTQRYAPLYEDDESPPYTPVEQPPPHSTFISSPPRAYAVVSDQDLSETGTEEIPFQLGRVSPSSIPSSSDSPAGTGKHTSSKCPRCMSLHLEPPSGSIDADYRSLTDLAGMEGIDSRIWLPKSRVFDPDKVKPRPWTRPSSPAKRDMSPVPNHESVSSTPQPPCRISVVNSPFVRVDRGRRSSLVPSRSLPIMPDRELKDDHSNLESRPIQLLANHHTDKGKGKELDYSVHNTSPTEKRTGCGPSLRSHGRSHIQLVPRHGRDEQSAIVVHCPPNCSHETCYCHPLALSAPTVVPPRPTSYVDACVSPIIAITARIQDADIPAKVRIKGSGLDGSHLYGLGGFTHVSHKGIAPEADVRSPVVKGMMVPMNAAE